STLLPYTTLFSALLVGNQTGHAAGKSGGQVAARHPQFPWLDGGNRSQNTFLFLRTKRHYRHLVQLARLVPKDKVYRRLPGVGNLLRDHPDEGRAQDRVGADVFQYKLAIFVRHDTPRASLDRYGGSGHWVAIFIGHRTLHTLL